MNYKNIAIRVIILGLFLFVSKSFIYGSIVVLNGLTHEQTSATGGIYKGTIEIQNTSDIEKSVKVYQRDYLFNYTGESIHDLPGTQPRSNSVWISYNPDLLNLEPGEKATISYEVNVPEDESLRGTYWSVIMVEGINSPDTTKSIKGVTINTAIRYAVQIVTNIGNTGTSDIQFSNLELTKNGPDNVLSVVIENTGERQLRPELALELFDENGNSVGVIKEEQRKTFPGTSIKAILDIKGIKPGKYSGVLVADCDEDHVFGTNVSFELE